MYLISLLEDTLPAHMTPAAFLEELLLDRHIDDVYVRRVPVAMRPRAC
jgi:hypothetical protein